MGISSIKFVLTYASSEGSTTHHRDIRKIYLSPEILKANRLCTGDLVAITTGGDDGSSSQNTTDFALGVVWPLLDLSQNSIVTSISLQLTARLQQSQDIRIFPLSGTATIKPPPPGIPSLRQAQEATTIRLKEILTLTEDSSSQPILKGSPATTTTTTTKRKDWLNLLLREHLVGLKYVTNKQILEVHYEGHQRRFAITSVAAKRSSSSDKTPSPDPPLLLSHGLENLSLHANPQIWLVSWDTEVSIMGTSPKEVEPQSIHKPTIEILNHHHHHHPQSKNDDAYSSVGGLEKQIAEIRDLLEIPLIRPELFRYFGLKPPRGILLHGPPGTGKTHLARAIASSTQSSVLIINGPELSSAYHGETESKLRDIFKEAREKSPCIVVLDEVDALAPRREEESVAGGGGGEVEKRVVATLLTILDGIDPGGEQMQDRVVVIGTTNRPNAIDPALRRPGRFDREIEIGVPDARARFSILKVLLSKTPHTISDEELATFASRAHGYVGADLSAIVREAGTIAIKRWVATTTTTPSSPENTLNLPPKLTITELTSSLPSVRPSAMRSLLVETPQIQYSDIGGQTTVIQKLREAIEWPLLHPEAFKRLGVRAPKGLLLYGPPGCSKTILARACACESGVNFVAVKGPELLNKYVGESEKGVREIFKKARAAAPSIIFFDEIDALATSRGSSDTEAGGAHKGVLTSLLNEIDGVQELIGVTIVAATNRPEVIDSALMRPGRLDRILFVGPPDQFGREEILRIKTKTMSVDINLNLAILAEVCDGFSGAELTSMCQEAAILEMQRDINAPFVSEISFILAAKTMKRQITSAVLEKYTNWRDNNEIRSL